MKYENGQWYMLGTSAEDPQRLTSVDALIDYVDQVGFLPLTSNGIAGFSVEEHVCPGDWWTEDPLHDPWEWRGIAARSGRVAYGKLFDKKAGFVSLEWLPSLINFRRDGYDFDSRYEEGIAKRREHLIMQQFEKHDEIPSHELKHLAGFGKQGEKNFSGVVTDLQMQTYLFIKDFRQRVNQKGQPYGMAAAVYAAPETLFGTEMIAAAYREEPEVSRAKIEQHLRTLYPHAEVAMIKKML